MPIAFEKVYQDILYWAQLCCIRVRDARLPAGTAGKFNGISATMNSAYSVEERTYYLVHALGSMVRWSVAPVSIQKMFDRLRDAKKKKDVDPARLEQAIDRYRAFETQSSEIAVWLLAYVEWSEVIPSYTNFMSADLEALTQFHRTGKAPVWRVFFARWNKEVASGARQVEPFRPKRISHFKPVKIETQEILQEQGK